MQPAGRRYVVDRRVAGRSDVAREASIAREGPRPAAARRYRVPASDPRRRDRRAAHSRRRDRVAGHRLAAGAAAVRLRLPGQRALESGHREIRRAGADLRHDRHLVHRHGDRGAGRPADRDVPDRAVPAMAAPADRHRDRAARRHSQHHLRHLGPVRVRAVPAADAAAVPDRRVRRHSGPVDAVRRSALRHRHADRRA